MLGSYCITSGRRKVSYTTSVPLVFGYHRYTRKASLSS
uniref:Uncharacterized protein n=1 Tax=Arundo donax TaxID=35708 RepID=A0A0A9DYX9_ARUDO